MSIELSMEKLLKIKKYGFSGGFLRRKSLQEIDIERPMPGAEEVLIEVLYCGVCHSGINQVENDQANTIYTGVPGYQIIGRIVTKGRAVKNFTENEIVGVGYMAGSDNHCKSYLNGEEQYPHGRVGMGVPYNRFFKPGQTNYNKYGGFSTHVIANKNFILRIPESMDITTVAHILSAGVTTFSPLKKWGISKGDKVGIIGIGGLGHMAVMMAKAMGAHVTAIATHEAKRLDAIELGADEVLVSEDYDAMLRQEISFDFLLCTIPVSFNINPYVKLLNPHGVLVTVGLFGPHPEPTNNLEVARYNRTTTGSSIGNITERQEVVDFCALHNIVSRVTMIDLYQINDSFDKIKDIDEPSTYIVDIASLKNSVQ